MNSENVKYLALVMELPAMMLAFGYILKWLDESYVLLNSYGMLVGLILGLVVWMAHAIYLMNTSTDESKNP